MYILRAIVELHAFGAHYLSSLIGGGPPTPLLRRLWAMWSPGLSIPTGIWLGLCKTFKVKRFQRLAVAIDTSGSISNEDLTVFFSEIHAMWRGGSEITIIEGSILDPAALAEAFKGVRVVFHHAARVSVSVATWLGGAYVVSRAVYPMLLGVEVDKTQSKRVFFATGPAYGIVYYLLGSTVWVALAG